MRQRFNESPFDNTEICIKANYNVTTRAFLASVPHLSRVRSESKLSRRAARIKPPKKCTGDIYDLSNSSRPRTKRRGSRENLRRWTLPGDIDSRIASGQNGKKGERETQVFGSLIIDENSA
ncbi:hypothetical protein CEXT_555161 [Caerostris extrusa]|uniref:Uncharacterized protein n=1 Tax=Caerostris extrusa TaxID=172846 RepID=A0AAV4Y3L0_CAEEX|nr:hypothetical protein CEXT_555161 [Caerostris extrusa]